MATYGVNNVYGAGGGGVTNIGKPAGGFYGYQPTPAAVPPPMAAPPPPPPVTPPPPPPPASPAAPPTASPTPPPKPAAPPPPAAIPPTPVSTPVPTAPVPPPVAGLQAAGPAADTSSTPELDGMGSGVRGTLGSRIPPQDSFILAGLKRAY